MGEISRQLIRTSSGGIGTFYRPLSHPVFNDSGPIRGYVIVFPRTSVSITHDGLAPVVADPNVVMFYNEGQLYRRDKLSEQGDLCDWFGFAQDTVLEAVRVHDPAVDDRRSMPFRFTHGPADSDIYMKQRLLIHHLTQTEHPDKLTIEEKSLAILRDAIAHTYRMNRPQSNDDCSGTTRLHVELVMAVKKLMASRFRESLSLAQIARSVYTSPYHLSRIFRKFTGQTIHSYLNHLRLRTSLAYVAQSDAGLTDLGLELGYSSHSHFTQAFRRVFGTAPSVFRQKASTRRIQQMSKILTAQLQPTRIL